MEQLAGFQDLVMCGAKDGYQLQIQSSLNTTIRLLNETTDPKVAPDPQLAQLAKDVNNFFEPKAKVLLQQKRAQLMAAGHAEAAARAEVTVHLTDNGLQLGYSYAMEHKEVAPTPRKSLLRRILGPLVIGRVLWTMPATDAAKGVYRKVRWPWLFWLLVLLAILVGSWSAMGAPGL
jgi:hypothetical protein